jgi:eukaryotic-like serine/threonine-protein kinase
VGDLSGQVLEGRYQIQERISDGAMGVVYRAVRMNLDRPVAVKVMHASLGEEMKGKERFEREALVMARLEHPHCVSIIDFGIHANKPFVVMELVRGRSLYEMLVEQGRFEVVRAVEIMRQVLSGLAHAHEQGIIHRDIKPANIMATPKAPLGVHVRILDFGLARMLGSSASISDGVTVGTPSYMAPEQCRGDTLDHGVDIYACGIVLFEMLTGRKPFVADEPIGIIKMHLQDAPPRLADVAPGDYGALEGVVARALAKAPQDRYPSAVAMADALEAAIAGRKAADTTAQLAPVKEASIDVPITVGSSVHVKHEPSSALRRSLPVSKARWWALLVLVLAVGWGIAAFVYLRGQEAEPIIDSVPVRDAAIVAVEAAVSTDPTIELVQNAQLLATAGKVDAAIDLLVDARKVYPDRAVLPATAGKLYFSKLWWADGIASFRAAIKIDPKLREDPEILDAVVRGFTTTPGTDGRLGSLLVEIGAPAASRLAEIEKSHPNPGIRARAAAMRKRLH